MQEMDTPMVLIQSKGNEACTKGKLDRGKITTTTIEEGDSSQEKKEQGFLEDND